MERLLQPHQVPVTLRWSILVLFGAVFYAICYLPKPANEELLLRCAAVQTFCDSTKDSLAIISHGVLRKEERQLLKNTNNLMDTISWQAQELTIQCQNVWRQEVKCADNALACTNSPNQVPSMDALILNVKQSLEWLHGNVSNVAVSIQATRDKSHAVYTRKKALDPSNLSRTFHVKHPPEDEDDTAAYMAQSILFDGYIRRIDATKIGIEVQVLEWEGFGGSSE